MHPAALLAAPFGNTLVLDPLSPMVFPCFIWHQKPFFAKSGHYADSVRRKIPDSA